MQVFSEMNRFMSEVSIADLHTNSRQRDQLRLVCQSTIICVRTSEHKIKAATRGVILSVREVLLNVSKQLLHRSAKPIESTFKIRVRCMQKAIRTFILLDLFEHILFCQSHFFAYVVAAGARMRWISSFASFDFANAFAGVILILSPGI